MLRWFDRWFKEKVMGRWYQGEFTPKNPKKCINLTLGGQKPFARSSWEMRLMNWCDSNKNVISWGSEIIKVPYIFEIDQKLHNYYPDIWCKIKDKDGLVQTYLVEVKPDKQQKKPVPPRNKTRKAMMNYNLALREYVKNQNKWKYAKRFCAGKNWKFRIITEKILF